MIASFIFHFHYTEKSGQCFLNHVPREKLSHAVLERQKVSNNKITILF